MSPDSQASRPAPPPESSPERPPAGSHADDSGSGEPVEPDHVYVIPPNCSLGLHHRRLLVLARREERGLHLPVDSFLQTLADDLGPKAIGVVLSGTGSDGTHGLKAIKAAGGMTFAQDQGSAEH